jgi:hypothetical protein
MQIRSSRKYIFVVNFCHVDEENFLAQMKWEGERQNNGPVRRT